MKLTMRSIGLLLCGTIFSTIISTQADPGPDAVDALLKNVKPNNPYPPNEVMENAQGNELLLAALKKDPSGPWGQYLTMWFFNQLGTAQTLPKEERKAAFQKVLAALQPARETVATRLKVSPETKATILQSFDDEARQAWLELGLHLDQIKASAQASLAANSDVKSWNYGNIIYQSESILGRVALGEGNLEEAKKHLLAAGKTPGSPQLNSFGPDFRLARELLERGERDTVLEFLDEVAKFWANPDQKSEANTKRVATDNRTQLESWKELIRAGKIPTGRQWQPVSLQR